MSERASAGRCLDTGLTVTEADELRAERDALAAWKEAVLEHGLCAHNVPISERCAECDSDFERDYPGVLARAALVVPEEQP